MGSYAASSWPSSEEEEGEGEGEGLVDGAVNRRLGCSRRQKAGGGGGRSIVTA